MGERFREAGLQRVAIVNDSVERNAAMVDKLLLDFPILSDADSALIKAWGLYNEREDVAKPSLILVNADRSIAFSYVGEDYTDRPTDDELFAAAARLGGGGDHGQG